MKILDEKGRLFGKLNVIDLLVLLVIVAVVIFAVVRFAGRGDVNDSGEDPTVTPITYTVRVRGVDRELYEQVIKYVDAEKGLKDQLLSGITMVDDGYVVDCVASPHITYVETADGRVVAAESTGDDHRLDLLFTIEATVVNPVINDVLGQQIRAGSYNTVKTVHFEFQGGTVMGYEYK